ncbi:hypothetical protein DID77_02050 [Candidatus Marinamargulisbacteria bacterium SCGC AG-439-L15]|nr:hypothetical protein DID77_02050 [Candidatus Marinamargulisbacteria bacterium SCGC AG-439-L15]
MKKIDKNDHNNDPISSMLNSTTDLKTVSYIAYKPYVLNKRVSMQTGDKMGVPKLEWAETIEDYNREKAKTLLLETFKKTESGPLATELYRLLTEEPKKSPGKQPQGISLISSAQLKNDDKEKERAAIRV